MENTDKKETEISKQVDEIMQTNIKEEKKGKKKKRKKGKKKFIIIGIIVLLLIIFFIFKAVSGSKNMVPVVETAVLSKGKIENVLSVTGPVEGTDSVDITSNLHAKIVEINVKEGDEVIAGVTVLAKIDTEDLLNEVERTKGEYELAKLQKDEKRNAQQNAYDKAASARNLAQDNYNRLSVLAAEGAISQAEFERAAAELRQANLELSSFKTSRGKVITDASADIQIKNAELALESVEKKLENATLIAPISGTVTRVNTKVGKFADYVDNRNTPLITIEKLDKLQIELLVSEYSIGKIRIGQKVKVSADILGKDKTIEGEVVSISPSGEIKEGSDRERVIPVKVEIKEGSGLISGINAKADILLEEKENTLVVPISAIGDDGTGQSVMQFIDINAEGSGVIKVLPVSTGIEGDMNIELLQDPFAEGGMSHEARYITTFNPELFEGMPVRYEIKEASESISKKADDAADTGDTQKDKDAVEESMPEKESGAGE